MKILFLGAALLVVGCSTAPKKHLPDILLRSQPDQKILSVEFLAQPQYLCGPTVLKMATSSFRPEIEFETLRDMAYSARLKGSVKSDMISTLRRLGISAYRVPDVEQMLEALNASRPVIVFHNLGLGWLPLWHYSLLIGYDAKEDALILHSDQIPAQKMDWSRFHATWVRGEKWAYLASPPEEIPTFAHVTEALDNALLFETLGKEDSVLKIYTAMTQRWPERYEAYSGVSNFYYRQKNFKQALEWAKRALNRNPEHPDLYYNLAVIYHTSGNKKNAEDFKRKAQALAPLRHFDF